jgi:succinoglycan biosynthesis transport protein ExoP
VPTAVTATGMEALAAIWSRRRWPALIVASMTLAATLAFARYLPNLYRATATLLVEPDPTPAYPGPGEMETRLTAMGQQILSRPRLLELIARYGLYPDLVGRASPEAITDQMTRDIQVEMKAFQSAMGARGPTTAFTVTYRGADPAKVAQVANALAALYVQADRRQQSEYVAVVRGQLEEMKNRLDEQEQRLGGLRGGGDLPQHLALNMATLDRLNSQLRLDIDGRMRAMERRATLLKQLAEADPRGGEEPDAAALRLAKLKRDYEQLRLRYSEKYPDVIRLKDEIAVLERQMAAPHDAPPPPPEGANPAAPASKLQEALRETDQEIKSLKLEEDNLRTEIADYYRRLQGAPEQEKEFQRLTRDDQTTRDLYNSLLKRYEEAQLKLTGGDATARLRVLDPAPVPKEAIAPDRFRILAVGLAAALALAALCAVAAEHLDASFHAVDDLRVFTRVPVLVSVPRIVTESDERRHWRRRAVLVACVLLGLGLVFNGARALARGNDQMVRLLGRSRA